MLKTVTIRRQAETFVLSSPTEHRFPAYALLCFKEEKTHRRPRVSQPNEPFTAVFVRTTHISPKGAHMVLSSILRIISTAVNAISD